MRGGDGVHLETIVAEFLIAHSSCSRVAIFGFLLSCPWEFLQVPFHQDMPQVTHWGGIVVCSLATIGDAVIMLAASDSLR